MAADKCASCGEPFGNRPMEKVEYRPMYSREVYFVHGKCVGGPIPQVVGNAGPSGLHDEPNCRLCLKPMTDGGVEVFGKPQYGSVHHQCGQDFTETWAGVAI